MPAVSPDPRRVSSGHVRPPARPAHPAAIAAAGAGSAGTTFVEGRDAQVAGGLVLLSATGMGALVAAATALLVALSILEVPFRFSSGALPGSSDPPSASQVAVAPSSSVVDGGGASAARGAGDVGPRALAPEVAPVLPAPGAATPVPRGGDGPPEGSLEQAGG